MAVVRIEKTRDYTVMSNHHLQNKSLSLKVKGLLSLMLALPENGRPCEDRIILKEFAKLREEAGLHRIVFHSLRHSSTTYKLKLNHGDLKATQGDTGHAEST